MSKFLAPIHYAMYDKILFLNDFVEHYIEIAKENNIELKELENMDVIENAPLEEIIDEENIHIWIQKRVDAVESRLAYVVSEMLNHDSELMIEVMKYAYRKGRNENFTSTAEDGFKLIISRFLDGMPCEGCLSIVETDRDYVKVVIEKDTHEKYWHYGADVENYWEIRNKYIKGLLSSSRYYLERTGNVYELKG